MRHVAASQPREPSAQGGAPLLLTYQGRLADPATGLPKPDGAYSAKFALYDAHQDGKEIWYEMQTVTVTRGLFNVLLGSVRPLSASDLDGAERWLELRVEGERLGPRVRLASVPYAIQAEEAKEAKNADTVDGLHASALGSDYENVIVVAKSGGDTTSIRKALESIKDAGPNNRYLVWVAPGTYTEKVTMKPYVDIEGAGERLTRITYPGFNVASDGTVIGADDAELRFLTVENTGGHAYAIAVFNFRVSPRLTHVTLSASGGGQDNFGVRNYEASPTMTYLTASASGGTDAVAVTNYRGSPTMKEVSASAAGASDKNYGIDNYSASVTMTNVIADASGGTDAFAVYNNNGGSARMTNVTASASGASDETYGVRNSGISPAVMNHVIAEASGGEYSVGVRIYGGTITMTNVSASGSNGRYNFGLYNHTTSPTIRDLTASASGGRHSTGVYNEYASPTIHNGVISGSDATYYNYAIYNGTATNTGAFTVTVSSSQLIGRSRTVYNNDTFTTLIGASLLDGGPVRVSGGTVMCAGVYDEDFKFYDNSCP